MNELFHEMKREWIILLMPSVNHHMAVWYECISQISWHIPANGEKQTLVYTVRCWQLEKIKVKCVSIAD